MFGTNSFGYKLDINELLDHYIVSIKVIDINNNEFLYYYTGGYISDDRKNARILTYDEIFNKTLILATEPSSADIDIDISID